MASLAHENVFSAAALLLFAVLGQVCESGPIRAERLFRRGALKRQELNRSVSDRAGVQSCITGQYDKTDVFFLAVRHVNLF